MVIDIEINKQLLRAIQERGDSICVQKTRYDQVPVSASSSPHLSGNQDIGVLTHLDGTVTNNEAEFSHIEPRPHTLSHLIDLLLCEILEVGVRGHGGHQKPDRKFIKRLRSIQRGSGTSAMTPSTDSVVVVQLMCMSNSAM